VVRRLWPGAHNLKVIGSNPIPATKKTRWISRLGRSGGFFHGSAGGRPGNHRLGRARGVGWVARLFARPAMRQGISPPVRNP
jgi:hypothetical protein